MPVNRSVPDVAEKRKNWNGLMSGFSTSDLVFLDESGCNTDMTRRYAYSFGGSRAVDSTPLSRPKNTTILSSIRLDGTLHYTTFSGGTTVERFKRYLETDLLPHLNGNSVFVMDNMKSHHAKAVRNLLDSSGVRCIYLPPKSTVLRMKYGAFLFAEASFWELHCFACTVFRLFAGGSDTPPTFDVTPFSKKNVCRPVHRIYSICRSFVFMPIFS